MSEINLKRCLDSIEYTPVVLQIRTALARWSHVLFPCNPRRFPYSIRPRTVTAEKTGVLSFSRQEKMWEKGLTSARKSSTRAVVYVSSTRPSRRASVPRDAKKTEEEMICSRRNCLFVACLIGTRLIPPHLTHMHTPCDAPSLDTNKNSTDISYHAEQAGRRFSKNSTKERSETKTADKTVAFFPVVAGTPQPSSQSRPPDGQSSTIITRATNKK